MAKAPSKALSKAPSKEPSDEKVNRRLIYGRRQGHRLQKKQARLVAELLPQLSPDLSLPERPDGWFGKKFSAYELEIGFGGGEHLAARAALNPDCGFIGCEPFINGVAIIDRHRG